MDLKGLNVILKQAALVEGTVSKHNITEEFLGRPSIIWIKNQFLIKVKFCQIYWHYLYVIYYTEIYIYNLAYLLEDCQHEIEDFSGHMWDINH